MITKLTLRNFKSVEKEIYEFTSFDLLVGRNNSGKSTVLQALAIWQFCVDEFRRSRRTGRSGIQVVLPNFTALPVPEFILLWKDRTDRAYPKDHAGQKKQEFILIEIVVDWQDSNSQPRTFGVHLRYHSPQTMYAIPADGWQHFREVEATGELPRIAYVPPFSGLEPEEMFLDISPMRQQVGKGQPGSVLRNLLLRVSSPSPRDVAGGDSKRTSPPRDWQELAEVVRQWFSVAIRQPRYESTRDVYITVEYSEGGRGYDIIAGGSGFHQTLTLLAFLFGYGPTTILLDEPDAHLHVNLQREILDYFKRKSHQLGTQFLIATHAEEFVRGVDTGQIVSLLNREPKRFGSTPAILRAMADVSNEDLTRLVSSPFILYVEGETDERILRAWAGVCNLQKSIDRICFKVMGGGTKADMKDLADKHFEALKQVIPEVSRLMLFDFDEADQAFHPAKDNLVLAEWKRKNIENYLLVDQAWKRAVLSKLEPTAGDLFAQASLKIVDDFFQDQNLTLPPNRTWQTVAANIFAVVDGKRILFENEDSLFQRLLQGEHKLSIPRDAVAMNMRPDEIHDDVHEFMQKMATMVGATEA